MIIKGECVASTSEHVGSINEQLRAIMSNCELVGCIGEQL